MVWNSLWPDGSKSVKQNTTTGNQNTSYTETTLNNDHFWNFGTDEDGHHRFMQTVATNDADKTLQTNTQLSTGMDLVYFSRYKTAIESVTQQDCQPYAKNIAGANPLYLNGVMQLLGIRAMVLFTVAAGVPTIRYKHNVKPITGVPATDGVERQSAGRFAIRFETALPSDDYLVLGGAQKNAAFAAFEPINSSVSSGPGIGNAKSTTELFYLTFVPNGILTDPFECWIICFGG